MSGLAGPGGYASHNAGFGGMNNLQPSQMSNGGGMGGGGMGAGGPGGGVGPPGSLGTPGSGTNGASGTNPETSSNGQTDYTLAGILHYLQSEWRRYERDRNEWEIERAEMRARIALLEGERRGIENLKTDLMRRVKMLEYALRQERSKFLSSAGNTASAIPAAKQASVVLQGEKSVSGSGRTSPSRSEPDAGIEGAGNLHAKAGSTVSLSSMTPSILGTLNGGPGSDGKGGASQLSRQLTTSAKDPRTRAKSREYLKQCLQEINYLTSASVLNPLPDRGIESMAGAPSASQAGPPRPRRTVGDNFSASTFSHQSEGSTFSMQGQNSYKRSPLSQGSVNAGSPQQAQQGGELARGGSFASKPPSTQDALIEANESMAEERFGGQNEDSTRAIRGPDSSAEQMQMPQPTIEIGKSDSPPPLPASEPSYHAPPKSPAMGTTPLPNGAIEPYLTDRDSASTSSPDSWGSTPSDDSEGRFTGVSEASSSSSDVAPAEDEHEREQVTAIFRPGAGGADDDEWKRLREAGQREREKREAERRTKAGESGPQLRQAASPAFHDDELASLTINDDETSSRAPSEVSDAQLWKSKRVLRSHLDAVRSISFENSNVCLVSASDDNTLKYWNVNAAAAQPASKTSTDADPVLTFRGHSAAVTSAIISSQQRRIYSGSLDATIRVWHVPRLDNPPYPPYNPAMEEATLVGHSQAIWELVLLPNRSQEETLLGSASADGTVKIWDTQDLSSALKLSWDYFGTEPDAEAEAEREQFATEGKEIPIPTSIASCPANLRVCAVAYSNSVIKLFDVQTGKETMKFKSDETYDGTPATQINKIVVHPTLPLLISGHEDRYIRMFDLDTGACTLSMQGHQDAVTSLDIDPAGLTLVSCGHDCSVRFWDLLSASETALEGGGKASSDKAMSGSGSAAAASNEGKIGSAAVCVQEISAHRKKAGEGVLAVKYHPSAPFFASAGADGIVRIYG